MTEDAPREPGGRDAAIERAYEEVAAICNGKRWTMRVPVEETDSDMVITAGLQRADALAAENAKLREALANARSYIPHNSPRVDEADLLADIAKLLGEKP